MVSKKIDRKRFRIAAFGSRQPVAPNSSEEGRKKNRRVEFVYITR